MAVPLSAADSTIIQHQVTLNSNLLASTSAQSGRDIDSLYDIQLTSKTLLDNRFKNVALQFPDELLIDSVPIFWALTDCLRRLQRRRRLQDQDTEKVSQEGLDSDSDLDLPNLYVLADTSYGNCCVDEVAAQHVSADVLVHYGHACLSPTSRLPVIYVFTKSSINIPNCISSLSTILQDSWFSLPPPASTSTSTSNSGIQTETETRPKALVLMYDISYAHAAEEVKEKLEQWLKESIGGGNVPEVILSRFDVERNFDGHLERIRREREEMEGDDEVERDRETENVKGGCCSSRSSTRLNGEGSCCEDEASESKVKNTGISGDSTSTSNCCNSNKSSMGCNSNRNPTSTSTSTSNPIPNQTASSIPLRTSSRVYSLPPSIDLQSCGIIYLGEESLSLTNLLLTLGPHSLVLSYSPLSKKSRLETGTTNRLLMRRYTLVQKARDASVIALLVGTLGINSYLPLLNSLRKLLTSKRSARKVYTISVGKLNPAKLANFQEIEMFVLIACEENSMVDGKDFFRPIVTPFEMLLALDDSREWTGEYKLELKGLVDGLEEVKKNSDNQDEVSEDSEKQTDSKIAEDQDSSDEEPHFSLITGGLVSRSKFSVSNAQASSIALSSGETPSNAIALRDETDQNSLPMSGANGEVILKSANGREVQVLQTASGRMGARNGGNGIGDREREWKGLEWSNSDWTGEKPALLEEGREGIAADMGEEERTGK